MIILKYGNKILKLNGKLWTYDGEPGPVEPGPLDKKLYECIWEWAEGDTTQDKIVWNVICKDPDSSYYNKNVNEFVNTYSLSIRSTDKSTSYVWAPGITDNFYSGLVSDIPDNGTYLWSVSVLPKSGKDYSKQFYDPEFTITKRGSGPTTEYVYYLRIKRPENYGVALNHVLLNGEMISSSDILYAGKYGVSDDLTNYTLMDDTQLNTLRTAGEQQVGLWANWVELEIHTTTPATTIGISTPQYYCPQSSVTVTIINDDTGTSTEYSETMSQNTSYNYEVK